jgi:hypothetical protein
LNENTRYLGGAFHAGAVPQLIEQLVEEGIGISQLRRRSDRPSCCCNRPRAARGAEARS